jgi:hypothetical protein
MASYNRAVNNADGREKRRRGRTFWLLATPMVLNVLGAGEGSNPVLPAQLNLDDFKRLIARTVTEILEQNAARQKRDVKGT